MDNILNRRPPALLSRFLSSPFRFLTRALRPDDLKHNQDTPKATRQTAHEQVPFNVQSYLDLGKALASEVHALLDEARMLLGEVDKLREERRALQHEVGYLLKVISSYGAGGEFEPDWKPPAPDVLPPPPPEPPTQPEPQPPSRSGWRSLKPRRKKEREAAPMNIPQSGSLGPAPAIPGVPMTMKMGPVDPGRQVTSEGMFDREPIRPAAEQANAMRVSDVLELIRLEREESAREREADRVQRERLRVRQEEERERMAEEREARIRALEQELANVKRKLDSEKQLRITDKAEARERERREIFEQGKEINNERWEDKPDARANMDIKMNQIQLMLDDLHGNMERDRQRAEELRAEADSRPGLKRIVEELTKQNQEQRELLISLSESWRADCLKHQQDTLEAIRQTAHEQVPFNVQGYLDDFSRALASEMRMLLGEVGKLREERRALQQELGYLLNIRSKYGPGGEFEPEWKPPAPDVPPPPPPEPPSLSGWRSVQFKRKKKDREAAPAPAAATVNMSQSGPSALAPAIPRMPMPMMMGPVDPRRQVTSWANWQPDPLTAPTPPPLEPTLLSPDQESPGLFGPRSPRILSL